MKHQKIKRRHFSFFSVHFRPPKHRKWSFFKYFAAIFAGASHRHSFLKTLSVKTSSVEMRIAAAHRVGAAIDTHIVPRGRLHLDALICNWTGLKFPPRAVKPHLPSAAKNHNSFIHPPKTSNPLTNQAGYETNSGTVLSYPRGGALWDLLIFSKSDRFCKRSMIVRRLRWF